MQHWRYHDICVSGRHQTFPMCLCCVLHWDELANVRPRTRATRSFKYVLLVVGHFTGYSVILMCCCRSPWQRGSRSSKAYLKGSQILHSPIGWVSQKICCCLADCHLGERGRVQKKDRSVWERKQG